MVKEEEVLWGRVQDLMKEVECLKTKVFDSFGARIAQCEITLEALDTRTSIFVPEKNAKFQEVKGYKAILGKFVTFMDKQSREVSKLKATVNELERVSKA